MNSGRFANDIITYIRQNIVPIVAEQEDPPTLDQVWRFRSQIHGLDLLIIQTNLPASLAHMVESMLSTSEALWNLISENEETVTNLKEYSRVRSLAAEAEGLTNLEELISGEDTIRDVIINSIAFMLNWKSNTIWVDSAKRSRQTLANSYFLEIQNRIWEFLKIGAQQTSEVDLNRINQIREKTENCIHLIRESEVTIEAQIAMLLQIYTLILRLQLGTLILRLEELITEEE
ncbi:hypothetical protein CMK22_01490 [Candidatus Poribacteria bacterium]|nr:hypothetical protein [Candidatus Poribacteria bacterium]